ncbi:probable blue-light-inducible Bli-3 protein [Ramularia collo-cygni]|uniref:Probable blue-light-inducible Bli-3 protein n=1 Tax=Ramularia collo-cygni TaxID=112498 RepID=A0A2D3UUD1_9PEZI|nr:probable blue-light-inducible Bli-3 protein [Ramularia collo-cygni]CZT14486.1 probable blue-light-inducible Bli-3 protein [Ramularia collo-cygni]
MSFSNTDTGSKNADPYTAKNQEEPSLKEKVEDFTQFVSKTKFCLLTTKAAGTDGLLVSRAMAVAGQEGKGVDLIFHTNTESGKTDDLDSSPDVNVGFIDSAGEWASISGKAKIETDRARVREHYSPALKAWLGDLGDGKHDGGPEDPRIGLIRVSAKTITYAISRKNFISSAIEVAKGAVTGESPQVNKLRHLEESELQQWRSS